MSKRTVTARRLRAFCSLDKPSGGLRQACTFCPDPGVHVLRITAAGLPTSVTAVCQNHIPSGRSFSILRGALGPDAVIELVAVQSDIFGGVL